MRCVSPDEMVGIFGAAGFSVSLAHEWYRRALVLDAAQAAKQIRRGARPPSKITYLPCFVRALNRWLPSMRARLFWIDHWEEGLYGAEQAILAAARLGLGETRSVEQAPGHLFEPYDYDEEDQLLVSREQAHAMAVLTGLVTLTLMTNSDAWLIADGSSDRIEFWEGNIFFRSQDSARMTRADELLTTFKCSRELI